jgi:hypothetical protein
MNKDLRFYKEAASGMFGVILDEFSRVRQKIRDDVG